MKTATRPNNNKKSLATKSSQKQRANAKKLLQKTKKIRNKSTILGQKRTVTNKSQPSAHDVNEYLRQRASQLLMADPVIQSLLSQQQNSTDNNNTTPQQSKSTLSSQSSNPKVTDKVAPHEEQHSLNNEQRKHVRSKDKRKHQSDPFQQLIAALDGNHKDIMSSDGEDNNDDWLFDNFFRSDPFFNPRLRNASSPLLSSSSSYSPRSIFAAQHPFLTSSKQRWKQEQHDYDNMMKNFLRHRIHPMSALHGVDLLDDSSSEDISSSDHDEHYIQQQKPKQQQQQQQENVTQPTTTSQKPIATLDNLPKGDLESLKQQLKQKYNNNIDDLLNDFFNTTTLNQIFPTIKQPHDNGEKQQQYVNVQDTNDVSSSSSGTEKTETLKNDVKQQLSSESDKADKVTPDNNGSNGSDALDNDTKKVAHDHSGDDNKTVKSSDSSNNNMADDNQQTKPSATTTTHNNNNDHTHDQRDKTFNNNNNDNKTNQKVQQQEQKQQQQQPLSSQTTSKPITDQKPRISHQVYKSTYYTDANGKTHFNVVQGNNDNPNSDGQMVYKLKRGIIDGENGTKVLDKIETGDIEQINAFLEKHGFVDDNNNNNNNNNNKSDIKINKNVVITHNKKEQKHVEGNNTTSSINNNNNNNNNNTQSTSTTSSTNTHFKPYQDNLTTQALHDVDMQPLNKSQRATIEKHLRKQFAKAAKDHLKEQHRKYQRDRERAAAASAIANFNDPFFSFGDNMMMNPFGYNNNNNRGRRNIDPFDDFFSPYGRNKSPFRF